MRRYVILKKHNLQGGYLREHVMKGTTGCAHWNRGSPRDSPLSVNGAQRDGPQVGAELGELRDVVRDLKERRGS